MSEEKPKVNEEEGPKVIWEGRDPHTNYYVRVVAVPEREGLTTFMDLIAEKECRNDAMGSARWERLDPNDFFSLRVITRAIYNALPKASK